MPKLYIVAGANGAGKSTLTAQIFPDIPVIDPDAIAHQISPLQPASVAVLAGKQAIIQTHA